MLAPNVASEPNSSQSGTEESAARTGMTMGEENGIHEVAREMPPSGSIIARNMITNESTSSIVAGICSCCMSWSEAAMAPSVA